jgi:tRNA modification GTPase
MRNNDTICAISTPAGIGGIAVVRLSGVEAKHLAESVLKQDSGKSVTLKDHRAQYAHFFDGEGFLDEVVVVWFAAPHSYTGEDVVEISCHGSSYIQQQTVNVFINKGARLAEPGEFTLRAFLNGRMNLSQAEAVADLIDSQSQMSHRLAVSQMRGGYAKELEQLRQDLIDTTALLELELDFSDEDLEFANRERLKDMVEGLYSKVKRLSDSFQTGNAIKKGVPVAIVGRPNAGKSTLLNALLNEDRAIVSDTPGTTRDTIEDTFSIDGIDFRIIDTAGLRNSDDPIEKMGIERTFRALDKASIVLLLHDSQMPYDDFKDDMVSIADRCPSDDKTLLIINTKCDICRPDVENGVMVSAKYGQGIDEIKSLLVKTVREKILKNTDVLLTNARHFEAMSKVINALDEVRKGLEANLTPDLIVIDMRDALYHLGTITGSVASDEVLSSVFSRFCIGK